MDLNGTEDMVIKTSAAIAAFLAVMKFGKKAIYLFIDLLKIPNRIRDIESSVISNGQKILSIQAELKTNGGSTIKDALNRIEEELYLRKQKIFLGLDATGDVGIFESDSDGLCIYISSGYTKLTGKNFDECSGHNWIYVVHEPDRDQVSQKWKNAIKDKRVFEEKYRIQKNDIPILIECRAFPIFNRKHEVSSYLGVLKPIKENQEISFLSKEKD